MIDTWKQIADDYEIAKSCLWCPKHSTTWHRDEDKGMFHLWRAYYNAINTDKKDNLLFARVLMMMSTEQRGIWEYERFNKYIAPAKAAYESAIAEGNIPTEKELQQVDFSYESLTYELKKTENTYEQTMEAYHCIEGLDEVNDFCFHDSKPIHFEHDDKRAVLVLDYDGVVVSFEFTGLVDIEVNGDPTCNWINDFYCYPAYHNPSLLKFDIGYYRILCERIRVKEVKR